MKTKTIVIAVASLAAIVGVSMSNVWMGSVTVRVMVTVLDNDTNQPIQGAEIKFLRPEEEQALGNLSEENRGKALHEIAGYARTDANGIGIVSRHCPASGGSFLFINTGTFGVAGAISVKSEGHEEVHELIQNFLGKKNFSISEKEHKLTIYLNKAAEEAHAISKNSDPLESKK